MDGPQDDLKWFGEGFDGFPKRLPEDCVEYMLFIVDPSLTQKEILTQLETIRKEALKFKKSLLKEYIWQRDEFNLRSEVQNSDGFKYLHGLTVYGDSVDDEWLIVYIMRELSRQFPNLWIKVVDTDGEFLLIEAANALPRWLNPEIADNRVWINDGKLRIIPLAAAQSSLVGTKAGPVSRPLTLAEANEMISTTPEVLIHSPLVEAEAFFRLRNYPAQISDSLHHSRIIIPRKLAYILHNCPASIAPAVEMFYLRDPIAMKQLQRDSSGLLLPPADMVTTSIRFTKVLFAQLKSQQFSAPNAWKTTIAEAKKAAAADHANQADFTSLELGMKITSGFEMLVSDPSYQDNRSVQEIKILLEDLVEGTTLPTDAEIVTWRDGDREDSESWLDINFEDFERELQGKQSMENKDAGPEGTFGPHPQAGFGDAKTQEDLKKMVQRFEQFLNDESAGIDGAEIEEMDFDDEDEDESEDEDEDEDKAISFDEKEFARMMREMMGMPPNEADEEHKSFIEARSDSSQARNIKKSDSNTEDEDGSDEGEEIRKVMQRMEEELNEAGALDLDPTPRELATLKPATSSDTAAEKYWMEKQDREDESEEEVNIDFNLAKNLLESFKSQAGMAGPGGNLMGMMGMHMPRDEDTSQSSKRKP